MLLSYIQYVYIYIFMYLYIYIYIFVNICVYKLQICIKNIHDYTHQYMYTSDIFHIYIYIYTLYLPRISQRFSQLPFPEVNELASDISVFEFDMAAAEAWENP